LIWVKFIIEENLFEIDQIFVKNAVRNFIEHPSKVCQKVYIQLCVSTDSIDWQTIDFPNREIR